jgi:signal transduction histidine kinase
MIYKILLGKFNIVHRRCRDSCSRSRRRFSLVRDKVATVPEAGRVNALNKELVEHLVHACPLPSLLVDQSTKIYIINKAALDLLGIKDNYPRKQLKEFLPDESRDQIREAFMELTTGDKQWSEQLIGIKITGIKLRLAIGRIFVFDEDGPKPQERFLVKFRTGLLEPLDPHGLKMASIGEFAAGIAHELNTPLANISLIAENLMEEIYDDDLKKELSKIIIQVEFSARIVKDLLAFSRKDDPTFEQVDLNMVVQDSLETMKFERMYKVSLELKEDLPMVKADPFQIQEVVMNILQNAKDSMREGGEILIRTGLNNGWVEITIEDTGHGIPKEILDKIFQPFYTTKAHGKGVGLGLAICKRIIAHHKGDILARNRVRKGSIFTIRLPKVT